MRVQLNEQVKNTYRFVAVSYKTDRSEQREVDAVNQGQAYVFARQMYPHCRILDMHQITNNTESENKFKKALAIPKQKKYTIKEGDDGLIKVYLGSQLLDTFPDRESAIDVYGDVIEMNESKKNELKDRAKKHRSTNKKGAMGWYNGAKPHGGAKLKVNNGDPKYNADAFNHAMGTGAKPVAPSSDGGNLGGASGGGTACESLERTQNVINKEYKSIRDMWEDIRFSDDLLDKNNKFVFTTKEEHIKFEFEWVETKDGLAPKFAIYDGNTLVSTLTGKPDDDIDEFFYESSWDLDKLKRRYQIDLEYVDPNGKYHHSHYCRVYDTYSEADNDLCNELSELEEKGCTYCQGDVEEMEDKYKTPFRHKPIAESLEGKTVDIINPDSIYCGEWGTVQYDNGDEIGVAIANGKDTVPIFSRDELKVTKDKRTKKESFDYNGDIVNESKFGGMPNYDIMTQYSVLDIDEDDLDWFIEDQERTVKDNGLKYDNRVDYDIHFFESSYLNDKHRQMSLEDAIQCLAIKDGVDFVRFRNGNLGFVAYYNNEENGFEIIGELDKYALELDEDTVKTKNGWTNKGKEGTHGKFKTKKEADTQRKAMFANGYRG